MFTTEELKEVILPYAKVIVDDGLIVCDWRDPIGTKHPGIRSQHDFIFTAIIVLVEWKQQLVNYVTLDLMRVHLAMFYEEEIALLQSFLTLPVATIPT